MFRIRPLEAHVQVIAVMRTLNVDNNAAALAGNWIGLELFTGHDQITNIRFLLFMAIKAAVTLGEGALATVITAFQGPFHRGLAGVKQGDFNRFHIAPVNDRAACGHCTLTNNSRRQ